MDEKAASAIRLNLGVEVIHNILDKGGLGKTTRFVCEEAIV